ncbi:carbohydrate ABC transporter permease [bacterium]|nr:carbohydrate ABC transporter permease [bacterium]
MPIISDIDRKSAKGRALTAWIYVTLLLGGLTMVYPFAVMLTGSVSNGFDYDRRDPAPRYLWSRQDRFMHMLCAYFPPAHRASLRQLRQYFPDLPEDWSLWSAIGDERQASDAWARKQLALLRDPDQRQCLETAARDYADFMRDWNVTETILAYDNRYIAPFLRGRYGTLAALNQAWQMTIDDFAKVNASEWSGEPVDQATYIPEVDVRYRDLLEFRKAYRENRFTAYLKGDPSAAGYLRPAALRFIWEDYVAKQDEKLKPEQLAALPFPVAAGVGGVTDPDGSRSVTAPTSPAHADLVALWEKFLLTEFPMRHVEIVVGNRQAEFERFLQRRFPSVDYLNRVLAGMGQAFEPVARWQDVRLTPTAPYGPLGRVWMDFVRETVPVTQWRIRDTLPEQAFQEFALARHGSLAGINTAYGLKLDSLEQLGVPFGQALLVTFAHKQWAFFFDNLAGNYVAVFDYLIHRGLAVRNTLILVILAICITLTVNPLAAYALSRFRLRQTEKIVVFCLATMAFPAAVAAIPGFLLLRDLGLLNTFAALVLPGAANGMTIFLLKGFFDSLPAELYEAATIDGAPEWTVFWRISLPLVKPILAVGMLNAFIAAYNGWEWAIIVAQDPKIWTIAVWTYQFSQTLTGAPYMVMASFIVNSIPVLLVFLFCQKIILRGIILPQMK